MLNPYWLLQNATPPPIIINPYSDPNQNLNNYTTPKYFTTYGITRDYDIKGDNVTIKGKENVVSKIISVLDAHITEKIKCDDDYFDVINGSRTVTQIEYPKIITRSITNGNKTITFIGKDYIINKIFKVLKNNLTPIDWNDDSEFLNSLLNPPSLTTPGTGMGTGTGTGTGIATTTPGMPTMGMGMRIGPGMPIISSTTPRTERIMETGMVPIMPTTSITYSGSGTTIFLKQNEKYYLVLIKEINKSGKWQAFGGKMEGDDILANAKKETLEESRMLFIIHKFVNPFSVDVLTPEEDYYKNYIICIDFHNNIEELKNLFTDNLIILIDSDKNDDSYYETSSIDFVDYTELIRMINDNRNTCNSLFGKIQIGLRTINVLKEIQKTKSIDNITKYNYTFRRVGDDYAVINTIHITNK